MVSLQLGAVQLGVAKAEVVEGPKEDSAKMVKAYLVIYAALLHKNLDAMTPSYMAQVKMTADSTAKKGNVDTYADFANVEICKQGQVHGELVSEAADPAAVWSALRPWPTSPQGLCL